MQVHGPAAHNGTNFAGKVPTSIRVAYAFRRANIREHVCKMVVISHHLPDAFGRNLHNHRSANLYSSFRGSDKLSHHALGGRGGVAWMRIGPIASNNPPNQE